MDWRNVAFACLLPVHITPPQWKRKKGDLLCKTGRVLVGTHFHQDSRDVSYLNHTCISVKMKVKKARKWVIRRKGKPVIHGQLITFPFSTRLVSMTIFPTRSCHTMRHMSLTDAFTGPAMCENKWLLRKALLSRVFSRWFFLVLTFTAMYIKAGRSP